MKRVALLLIELAGWTLFAVLLVVGVLAIGISVSRLITELAAAVSRG